MVAREREHSAEEVAVVSPPLAVKDDDRIADGTGGPYSDDVVAEAAVVSPGVPLLSLFREVLSSSRMSLQRGKEDEEWERAVSHK